jgi:hypothetical protein
LWALWFFSRFFNETYHGVTITILAVGLLLQMDEKSHISHTNFLPLSKGE